MIAILSFIGFTLLVAVVAYYATRKTNDLNYNRTEYTAVMRGFEGGDIKGITQKINEGYFNDLGINAI